jgi:hypothetical protein
MPGPATDAPPPPPGFGGEVADLVRCLPGVQANNTGWPVFNGRYVEYPGFRKEWWLIGRHTMGMSGTS